MRGEESNVSTPQKKQRQKDTEQRKTKNYVCTCPVLDKKAERVPNIGYGRKSNEQERGVVCVIHASGGGVGAIVNVRRD